MSEVKAFLKKVHIKNYLSLQGVELQLKPLTIIIGPNASGKSNILRALQLLNQMVIYEDPPRVESIRDSLWAGEASHITFQLQTEMGETPTFYELGLKAEVDNRYFAEKLSVKGIQVISIKNGQGVVRDEDGGNETKYKSNKLALGSAGNYGNKPITSALAEFIKDWEFYDFQPGDMRRDLPRLKALLLGESKELSESPKLNDDGSTLSALLSYWYENDEERFARVSGSLDNSTNLKIHHCSINGELQLCLLEGYKNPIPLKGASDGTLRLIAYYILLNEPELPQLIAIEEPERNLHPGALKDIAKVLEQLSERTQVIITTHSSQLLDNFKSGSLSNSLGILLLRNRPGLGTEVMNLEEIRGKREALDGWISDFGIGSAVFDSGLLQDLMEEPVC